MKSNTLFLVFVLMIVLSSLVSAEGFGGTIILRDGNTIEFLYLGNLERVADRFIRGVYKGASVKYPFETFKEIHFAEKNKDYRDPFYDGTTGDILVVLPGGDRLTISKAHIDGQLSFVFQDPITGKLTSNRKSCGRSIFAILIGEEKGSIKYNPRTGDYFPWTFNYDPYTGDRLIWTEE